MAFLNLKGRLSPASIRLALVVAALLIFGLVMVYSASYGYAFGEYSATKDDLTYYFKRQLIAAVVGIILMVALAIFDYRYLPRFATWILGGTFLLILPTAFFGRWLFGSWGQLAEMARLLAIIYLAIWLAQKGDEIRNLKLGFLPFGLLVGLITGLIVLQPDISTAALMFVTAMAMVFVAGADLRQIIPTIFIVAPLVIGVALLLKHGDRIFLWLGSSFQGVADQDSQVAQCLQAINRGGFFGVGLGQSELKYVIYAAHSDAIFAIIGEELGFLGTSAVIALYGLWTWWGLQVAREARDPLGRLLATGLTIWVTLGAVMHVAGSLNAIPFSGSVLPFISSGGSSLLTTLASVGILLNITRVEPETAPGGLR
ncbi:MAG: FtsW/RodA/SpoVE family cell cycle protein [Anaerolineae bacterium]